jgi:hypothetical protein
LGDGHVGRKAETLKTEKAEIGKRKAETLKANKKLRDSESGKVKR